MISQAIILAGGFGTRLQSVVSDVPKPMAPINGRPFLDFVLDQCVLYNIKKIILAVGYKKEVIINHFKNNYKGIDIQYSIEEEALGTGGGIAQAAAMLNDEPFFVLNGDTLFKTNLENLARFYEENHADMAVALCKMQNFDRYGVVKINEQQRITAFVEKQYQAQGNINAGVYVLNKAILNKSQLPQKFSFEKDFMEKFIQQYKFYGLATLDYFIDIGVPEDYEKAQSDLKI